MARKPVFTFSGRDIRSRGGILALSAVLACGAPGCDSRDLRRELAVRWKSMRARIDALLLPPSAQDVARQERERDMRRNAELLHEVFQVVLLREPVSTLEFGTYMNSLNQGASIEGIYNGFVSSDNYRKLERMGPPAKLKTLHTFVEELQALERELPRPTDFDIPTPAGSSRLLPRFRLLLRFQPASFYTLKRVAGNEALKVIEAKERAPGLSAAERKEGLARWYGQWAARLAGRGVDFGLPLRNNPDARFHRDWALRASRDSLTWEVLNRLHRLLNAAEAAAPAGIAATVDEGPSRVVAEGDQGGDDVGGNPNVVTFPGPKKKK